MRIKSSYGLFLCLLICSFFVKAQSFKDITLRSGSKNYTIISETGKQWTFRAYTPSKVDNASKVPLVIALHWAGGSGTYEPFHDCLIIPGLKALDAIVISPEGDSQSWSSPHNIKKVQTLIASAIKYWNVDPNRVVLTGYSRGGLGSWFFAKNHPELFSAVIPMASIHKQENKLNVPIYAIQGGKDNLFPAEKLRKWVNSSKENLSHYQGCDYATELKKIIPWLKTTWNQ